MYKNSRRESNTNMDCSSIEQVETELDREYTELFVTMDKEMEDIFMTPVVEDYEEFHQKQYNFCVLCGLLMNEHFKNHNFIQSKDEHRCLTCHKFFFEHYPHVNSCYNPIRAVQYGEF